MKGPVPDSWCDSVNPLMFCVGLWRWPGSGAGQDGGWGVGGFRSVGDEEASAARGFVPVLCQTTGIFTRLFCRGLYASVCLNVCVYGQICGIAPFLILCKSP